ncbi:unnamed protein product, partial [Amoebophrya sp. A120]
NKKRGGVCSRGALCVPWGRFAAWGGWVALCRWGVSLAKTEPSKELEDAGALARVSATGLLTHPAGAQMADPFQGIRSSSARRSAAAEPGATTAAASTNSGSRIAMDKDTTPATGRGGLGLRDSHCASFEVWRRAPLVKLYKLHTPRTGSPSLLLMLGISPGLLLGIG